MRHGANITFLLWGLLHGLLRLIEEIWETIVKSTLIRDIASSMPRCIEIAIVRLSTLCTFIVVSILWVFFRASSINDAIYVLRNMLVAPSISSALGDIANIINLQLINSYYFRHFYIAVCVLNVALIVLLDYSAKKRKNWSTIPLPTRKVLRWIVYLCLGSSSTVSFLKSMHNNDLRVRF